MWVNDLTGFVIIKRMRLHLEVIERHARDGLGVVTVFGGKVQDVGNEVDDLLMADVFATYARVFR